MTRRERCETLADRLGLTMVGRPARADLQRPADPCQARATGCSGTACLRGSDNGLPGGAGPGDDRPRRRAAGDLYERGERTSTVAGFPMSEALDGVPPACGRSGPSTASRFTSPGARLTDPALGRDPPRAALRRPPGVPCPPGRAAPRTRREKLIWPAARPRRVAASDGSRALYEQKVERYLRKGYSKASRRNSRRGVDYDVLPFLFLAGAAAPESPAAARGARVAAGGLRRVLHLVLQRVARRPEPPLRPEARRRRVRRPGWRGAGDGRGRVLRGYPDGGARRRSCVIREGWYESARRTRRPMRSRRGGLAEWRASTRGRGRGEAGAGRDRVMLVGTRSSSASRSGDGAASPGGSG